MIPLPDPSNDPLFKFMIWFPLVVLAFCLIVDILP